MEDNNGGMDGKVVLITGGTGGIGKDTAVGLARCGAHVVLVGRDKEKGQAAVSDVEHRAEDGSAELVVADLSSQAEIRRLAYAFTARHSRLDVLLNNVGVYCPNRSLTVDGLERTFAVNHLASFLLTNLLLSLLEESASSRVVTVSSGAHVQGKIDFDNLQGDKNYDGMRAYSQSKLANVLFTYELARRQRGTGVTANCLEPGFVNTDIALPFLLRILKPFAASPEKGARAPIYLANSPEVKEVSGKYFDSKGRVRNSSAASYDEGEARRLWKISEQLTGLEGSGDISATT